MNYKFYSYWLTIGAIYFFALLCISPARGNTHVPDTSNIQKKYLTYINNLEYDSALSLVSEYKDYTESGELWRLHASSILMLSNIYYRLNNIDSVAYYTSVADHVISKWEIAEKQLKYESAFFHGWIYYRQQITDSALLFFNSALNTLRDIENDSLKVNTYKLLGNTHLIRREFNAARKNYLSALVLEKSRKIPSDVTIASLFQNIGITFASQMLNDSAGYYFEKSIALKERILPPEDPKLARGYMNLSRFLSSTGDVIGALQYINKAEVIFLKYYGQGSADLAGLYFNKGSVLILLEDYDEALIYHELALDIYSKTLNSDSPTLSRIYLNLGIIYNALGKYKEAITYLRKMSDNDAESDQQIKCYWMLGTCYDNLKDNENAEQYYLKAILIAEKIEGPDINAASSYDKYGLYCMNLGDLKNAEKFQQKALRIYKQIFGVKSRDVSNILTNLGRIYYSSEKYQLALVYFQKALESGLEFYSDSSIYSNPAIDRLTEDINIFHTLYRKSFTFSQFYQEITGDKKDLQMAFQTAELSIQLFDKIKANLGNDNAKLLLTGKSNEIYDLAIETSAKLYQLTGNVEYLEKSFSFSEKNKAAVLLSSIRKTEALQIETIPEQIKNKEQEIRKEIARFQNLVLEEGYRVSPDSVKLTKWKKHLFDKKMQYDSLISILEENYPSYYNLKYNSKIIGSNEIQKNIAADGAFIEYKLVNSTVYAWVITSDTILLSAVQVDTGFVDQVRKFTLMMSSFPAVENATEGFKSYTHEGYEIFTKLFSFYPLIREKERLIIIPDDFLGFLSFEALPCKLPDDDRVNYKALDYILKNHAITYSYSGTLLYNRIPVKNSHQSLLAMAPDYDKVGGNLVSNDPKQRNIADYLIPLLHTKQEVENISKIFNSKVLTGSKATETYFKQHADAYTLLHFAMHTYIDDEDPLASKLVFSLEGDTVNDGFLNVFEIYNLNLNAQLAVLSACKTGVGRISKGEGIMSVARAFLFAGVPGIVMSLWSIEDVSSAEIMSNFYSYLKDYKSKDEALRAAKLDYLNNANQLQAHPYFWSAYVQIGDNAPLVKPAYFTWISLGVVLILAFAGGWLTIRRKNKHNRNAN